MNCEKCVYCDEDRDNQPRCNCQGQNFEEEENEIHRELAEQMFTMSLLRAN